MKRKPFAALFGILFLSRPFLDVGNFELQLKSIYKRLQRHLAKESSDYSSIALDDEVDEVLQFEEQDTDSDLGADWERENLDSEKSQERYESLCRGENKRADAVRKLEN